VRISRGALWTFGLLRLLLRTGIRNFIVETIISQSSDEANLRKQKTFINKLDMTLIQVRTDLSQSALLSLSLTSSLHFQ
jgi:hypothetical protein